MHLCGEKKQKMRHYMTVAKTAMLSLPRGNAFSWQSCEPSAYLYKPRRD